MSQITNFILFQGLWVLVTVGLFDGVRRIVTSGASRRTIYQVAACALASIAMCSFYLWAHIQEESIIKFLDKNIYSELPNGWAPNLTIEARAKASYSYASTAFMGAGVLLKHSDSLGNWVLFQPTPEDISQREEAIVVRVRLEEQSQSFWGLALGWAMSAVLASFFGYFSGRREVRNGG